MKAGPLLDPRERHNLNLGMISGFERRSSFSCLQMCGLEELGDHLSSDNGRE